MEALLVQSWEEEEATMKGLEGGESGEQGEGGTGASSPAGSTADEETDEDSEPEPSSAVRRKVSFADAFGLDLVSVKEFDIVEAKEPEVSRPPEREAARPLEEFYLTCLFTVPGSPEELDQRLRAQMVELETVELLPGTAKIRGTIRVVNLCYSKTVRVRVSLDGWQSYFDLLAEYVPGSSDRETDRFTFKYALVPPFEKEGTRVELCLRYDTSAGTFWANNRGMNYVLFCHRKGHGNEPQTPEEGGGGGYRGKRSCLRANRRGSVEEKTREPSNTPPEATEADKSEETDRKMTDRAETQSLCCKERKSLVDAIKSRHRATRLARVRDYLAQRGQHAPQARSCDPASSHEISQPRKISNESPRVLTYHEIPLLTLDWNVNKGRQSGTLDMGDVWTGRTETPPPTAPVEDDTRSPNDMWEMIYNGTDDIGNKEISVCDVWQQFLNGLSCAGYSGVPESEWLQTAASVSPSSDNESKEQHAGTSQERAFRVGSDTPTAPHADISASCQSLPDIRKTSPDNFASNTADRRPAQPRVSSRTDDDAATRDAPRRSETNSATDTLQEFSPEGPTPVSNGVSSTERHKPAVREGVRRGKIEGAEGRGGGDSVTSSGELETTGLAATAECLNASAVDRISDRAGLDEGLSSSRDGRETGTKHSMMDDRLAFRETVRQDTKNVERFVSPAPRQGAEEEIVNNGVENKASAGEEIFGPQETEESEISQRFADKKQQFEFSLNRNTEKPRQNESHEDETRPEWSQVDEFNASQSCDSKTQEMSPSAHTRPVVETRETIEVLPGEYDTSRPFPSDKCNSTPLEETKTTRWSHSHGDTKGQQEDVGRGISPVAKDDIAATSTSELQRRPETLEDVSRRDEGERVSLRVLKGEALGELLGEVGISWGEGEKAPAPSEESLAGVENSPRLDCQTLSGGRKDPVVAASDGALEVIESGSEKIFIERFGDDLVKGIWEEVFCLKAPASNRDLRIVGGAAGELAGPPDNTQDGRPSEKDLSDAWESRVFTSADSLSLCRGLEETLKAECSENTPKEGGRSVIPYFLSGLRRDSDSRAHLRQDLASVLAGRCDQSPGSAQSSQNDWEHCTQIKGRSITRQEAGRHTEGGVVTRKESLDPSDCPPPIAQSNSSEKLTVCVWWSVLYVLVHVTRLLVCVVFVAGFFYVVFLCDFPAFFALYMLSLAWWLYTWRRHRATANKAMAD